MLTISIARLPSNQNMRLDNIFVTISIAAGALVDMESFTESHYKPPILNRDALRLYALDNAELHLNHFPKSGRPVEILKWAGSLFFRPVLRFEEIFHPQEVAFFLPKMEQTKICSTNIAKASK